MSRLVTYFGNTFTVSNWVSYLALDDSGELWGHEFKPVYNEDSFSSDGKKEYITFYYNFPVMEVE